jgi:hypothetical protein
MTWAGVAMVAAFALLLRLAIRRRRQGHEVSEWRAPVYAVVLTGMLLSGVALIFAGI